MAPARAEPSIPRARDAACAARVVPLAAQDDFTFQKLEVLEERMGAGQITSEDGSEAAELAQVDFRVDFVQKGTLNLMVLRETSTFRKDAEGRWLYAKGDVEYEAQSADFTPEEAEAIRAKAAEVFAAQQ